MSTAKFSTMKKSHKTPLAMMLRAYDTALAMSYSVEHEQPRINFAESREPIEFGLDNCATHHICVDKPLFKTLLVPEKKIGVQGVAGSLSAEGLGTVEFTTRDDDGKNHSIALENVILLPSAPKNLISISRWSKDLKDDTLNIFEI